MEDIAAPRCFEVEARLKERLKIPVFHDDQHGTAIVVLAGLINALKVVGKDKSVKVVINGSGAAGIAITQLLYAYGFRNLIVLDTVGALYQGRVDNMNEVKIKIAGMTNPERKSGDLAEVMAGADVFIGVSKAGLVNKEMVKSMTAKAVVFAMANPDPEISEANAKEAAAALVPTGRSDSQNQLNNVLVFPGIFRGALDARIITFTEAMFLKAAEALASLVPDPSAEKIIPTPFEPGVSEAIARAVTAPV